MEHCHVTWRLYEHRRDVTPFQDVCWYSGWIMGGKQKMVCHLPELVLRQYRYVQTVPRSPTMILPLAPADVLPSWSLFCTSLASRRGVTRSHTTSLGSIQIGTLGGSTVYLILPSSTLLQSLRLSCRDLSTRIFLLTRIVPDILPIHCRSSAA